MYHTAILNPGLNELLGRIRHTNTLVISDKGFPFWPDIELIDLSLVDDKPSVLDVLQALLPQFTIGAAWMAEEFRTHNGQELQAAFADVLAPVETQFLPHDRFKERVPTAIGLIRTGGTASYSNIILESA